MKVDTIMSIEYGIADITRVNRTGGFRKLVSKNMKIHGKVKHVKIGSIYYFEKSPFMEYDKDNKNILVNVKPRWRKPYYRKKRTKRFNK